MLMRNPLLFGMACFHHRRLLARETAALFPIMSEPAIFK
jgi:hypothetical protein